MPTTRLSFTAPYQPETPWGAALANAANLMFGGPTAYEVEAQQATRDSARAAAALKQNELEGRTKLGDIISEWTTAAADPAAREAMFKTYAPRLAEAAARYGYDPAKAIEGFRLSLATPIASEQNRAYGAYATKGSIAPFSSFGDLGAQRAAEQRETASKATVAATGAAAANPDKYQRVRLINEELKGQPVGSFDRRVIAGLETKPTAGERADADAARKFGVSPTDMAAYRVANETAKLYKSPFGEGIDYKAFERDHPELARTHRRVLSSIAQAQASPNVPGQRKRVMASGNEDWEVPSDLARGQYVPAWRDPGDGQWRKLEADGKVYILRQRDR